MATITMSLRDLTEAEEKLRDVELLLTGTNSYAAGPRRDLGAAFETLRREIESSRRSWSEES